MIFKATRLEKTYEMTVPASREMVFPLLCPVREYDWLPYWNCTMIYSATGRAELGAVFRTEVPGKGEATWIVTQYHPAKTIAYKTPSVETTTSLAASPVCRATVIFQSKPNGANAGSRNFPIRPR